MGVFKRFSGLGKSAVGETDIIENRDCLYAPYAEKRSSYLRKKDLMRPCHDFPGELPEDKSQLRISELKFSDDDKKVKKLSKRM